MKVRYRRFVRQASPGFPVRKTGATPAAVCELSGWKTRFAGEAKQMVPACCQCRGTGTERVRPDQTKRFCRRNTRKIRNHCQPNDGRWNQWPSYHTSRWRAKSRAGKSFGIFGAGEEKANVLRDGIRKSPFSAARPCGDSRVPSGALRFRGRTIRRHGAVPACFAGCRCRR